MKVSTQEVKSGPIRWLMRLSGWFCLTIGIAALTLSQYVDLRNLGFYNGPLQPLLIGGLLVVLDLFLPDPVRAQRRLRKKYRKLYQKICTALPSNQALFNMVVTPATSALLERQLRTQSSLSRTLFQKAPTKEMLIFIHSCNQNAAYDLCAEMVRNAQKAAEK